MGALIILGILLLSQYIVLGIILFVEGEKPNESLGISKKDMLQLWKPFGWVPLLLKKIIKHIEYLKRD